MLPLQDGDKLLRVMNVKEDCKVANKNKKMKELYPEVKERQLDVNDLIIKLNSKFDLTEQQVELKEKNDIFMLVVRPNIQLPEHKTPENARTSAPAQTSIEQNYSLENLLEIFNQNKSRVREVWNHYHELGFPNAGQRLCEEMLRPLGPPGPPAPDRPGIFREDSEPPKNEGGRKAS